VTSAPFHAKAGEFEGPMDLLLELIEKRKLFINDVSLAVVADDYIKHVETRKGFPVPEVAHFILIASTLVLIKSKSLLPGFELTPEESSDIDDLEKRLRLYKRIRVLSAHVMERFGKHIMFVQQHASYREPIFTPDKRLSRGQLLVIARGVISRFPTAEKLSKVMVDKVMSLEDMIERLSTRIKSSLQISFRDFTKSGNGGREEKINLIVSFLAMLELVKQGAIAVEQSGAFDDINMESQEISTPKYG